VKKDSHSLTAEIGDIQVNEEKREVTHTFPGYAPEPGCRPWASARKTHIGPYKRRTVPGNAAVQQSDRMNDSRRPPDHTEPANFLTCVTVERDILRMIPMHAGQNRM
jgi:hypothetical protein